jgi:hypothetical protein
MSFTTVGRCAGLGRLFAAPPLPAVEALCPAAGAVVVVAVVAVGLSETFAVGFTIFDCNFPCLSTCWLRPLLLDDDEDDDDDAAVVLVFPTLFVVLLLVLAAGTCCGLVGGAGALAA